MPEESGPVAAPTTTEKAPAEQEAEKETSTGPAVPLIPRLPSILLEGDEPSVAAAKLSIRQFAPRAPVAPGVSPAPPPEPAAGVYAEVEIAELPEAYGTGELTLTVRDPRCIYAHWDIAPEQQRRYNALSTHGHLVVRVFDAGARGQPPAETHVHPESRRWFLHVPRPAASYVAELGYYAGEADWRSIATSAPVTTPPEAPAEEKAARFVTIPFEAPLPGSFALAPPAAPAFRSHAIGAGVATAQPAAPSRRGAARARATAVPEPAEPAMLPKTGGRVLEWTAEQEAALARVVTGAFARRERIGSQEIGELVRQAAGPELASIAAARQEQAPPPPQEWITSPGAGQAQPRGFWFSINAELIIYGATEADAWVTIGGREVKLRPDGSFSFHFTLPDGQYELPIIATGANGEQRRAVLEFRRGTRHEGAVSAHPQDAALRPPTPENAS